MRSVYPPRSPHSNGGMTAGLSKFRGTGLAIGVKRRQGFRLSSTASFERAESEVDGLAMGLAMAGS